MRRSYRTLGAGLVLGVVLPWWSPATAYAEARTPTLERANWFWQDQIDGDIGGTGIGTRLPSSSSGIPDPDLGIAYTTGKPLADPGSTQPADTPNKEAYLGWSDFDSIDKGSQVQSFAFTITIDPAASATPPMETVPLIACLSVSDWPDANPGGGSFSGKPTDDCNVSVPGIPAADGKTYTFDATKIAQAWVDTGLNLGLGIRPKLGYTTPFQLAVTRTVTGLLTFTPAATAEPTPAPCATSADTTAADTTAAGTGTTSIGGFSGGSVSPDVPTTDVGAVTAPNLAALAAPPRRRPAPPLQARPSPPQSRERSHR